VALCEPKGLQALRAWLLLCCPSGTKYILPVETLIKLALMGLKPLATQGKPWAGKAGRFTYWYRQAVPAYLRLRGPHVLFLRLKPWQVGADEIGEIRGITRLDGSFVNQGPGFQFRKRQVTR
jgi:hypothetical protein